MMTKLCEGIHWVGYVDWTVRDFHGYTTERGTTYNAYLVQDEKTALIDTVKAPFAERLLENVRAHADPATIDYVVCNHAEPDHAGSLPAVMKACEGRARLQHALQGRSVAPHRHVRLALPHRGRGRYAGAGPTVAALHRDADGALAGVHVLLRARRKAPVLDGRIRTALRLVEPVR
jgi:glyoxylase-like metal-dependent hydrolase (beta-lactamase superfamily II)